MSTNRKIIAVDLNALIRTLENGIAIAMVLFIFVLGAVIAEGNFLAVAKQAWSNGSLCVASSIFAFGLWAHYFSMRKRRLACFMAGVAVLLMLTFVALSVNEYTLHAQAQALVAQMNQPPPVSPWRTGVQFYAIFLTLGVYGLLAYFHSRIGASEDSDPHIPSNSIDFSEKV